MKAIFLDIDNTLLSFDESVKDTMKSGFPKFGIDRYEDGMFAVFNRINSDLWQALERGEIDFEELKKTRWNKIFAELGIAADGEAFEKYFRDRLFDSAIPENGAIGLLGYLSQKYILCAASNGPYHQQVNRLKIGGMLPYFSHLFISEEIGFQKPSEDFFRICMQRLNETASQEILPCEVTVIGDSLSSDMAGGIRFGMQTCFYNPTGKPIPADLPITHSVRSLKEIERFL